MYTKNEKDKIKFLQKKNMNKIREEKDRKQWKICGHLLKFFWGISFDEFDNLFKV